MPCMPSDTKYPQYRNDPPDGPVIAIEIEAIRGWRAAD